jgi:hypothetical protein
MTSDESAHHRSLMLRPVSAARDKPLVALKNAIGAVSPAHQMSLPIQVNHTVPFDRAMNPPSNNELERIQNRVVDFRNARRRALSAARKRGAWKCLRLQSIAVPSLAFSSRTVRRIISILNHV